MGKGWDRAAGATPRAVGGGLAATTYTLQDDLRVIRRNKGKNMSDGGNNISKCYGLNCAPQISC